MIPALIKIDASKESPKKEQDYYVIIKYQGQEFKHRGYYTFNKGWYLDNGEILFWYKEVLVHTEEEVKEAYVDGAGEAPFNITLDAAADEYYNEKFKKI